MNNSTLQLLRPDLARLLEAQGFAVAACMDIQHENLQQDMQGLEKWLAEGAHAQMHFMEENKEARQNSSLILSNARTALSVLVPYATGDRVRRGRADAVHAQEQFQAPITNSSASLAELELPTPGSLAKKHLIARYARGKDYHKIIKKQLSKALDTFATISKLVFSYRVVVDSIPFLDRAHARLAGLGFVGKNTMLIRPGMGSYFFIATVLLSLEKSDVCELQKEDLNANAIANSTNKANSPMARLDCGTCRRCMDACPTQALPRPYFLDANKCLSYLSIEHRDVVPEKYLPFFKDSLYGCDICQEACPYNFSTLDLVQEAELRKIHTPLTKISAVDVAGMNQQQYEEWFGGTALTRAKYGGLVRNALYHLYATQATELTRLLALRSNDTDPLILNTVQQLLLLQHNAPQTKI